MKPHTIQQDDSGAWRVYDPSGAPLGKPYASKAEAQAACDKMNMDMPKEAVAAKAALLSESMDLSEAKFGDDNVLRNVVLIRAGMSKNRRSYSERVLQAAAPVFEGVKAYNDHARQHKATDITGWYSNVRYAEGALRADRYFAPTQAGKDVQALANEIVSGRAPATLAGLSIAAEGRVKAVRHEDGDVLEVESINAAESVDDVANPAAGGTYLAAGAGDALTMALFKDMTIEEFTEARPDYIKRLQKEWKTMRDGDAVKAAEADAGTLRAALQEAQAALTDLNDARDAAVLEAQAARRELAVEQVLNDPKVKLTALWKTELRAKLAASDPPTWVSQIESYQRLAASAGHKPVVSVSGAGQQVSGTGTTPANPVLEARRRLAAASSPDEVLRILER